MTIRRELTRFAFALHTVGKLFRDIKLFVRQLQHKVLAYCVIQDKQANPGAL
jgi:hypothetical protein